MSNNEDPTGPAKGPAPDAAPSAKRRGRIGSEDRAEARRDAFKAMMHRLDTYPTDIARRAGLSNANSLFNFLSKRSASLAQSTLDRIVAAFPGTRADEWTGRLPPDPAFRPGNLWAVARGGWPVLTCEAEAGAWRRSARLPPQKWVLVPMPSDLPPPGPLAFAVRLKGRGADLLYPVGTVAVCLPLQQMLPSISTGCRVLVRLERRQRHELTVKELVIEEAQAWLWPRSSDPVHHAPIAVPWPLHGPVAVGAGVDATLLSIEGAVVATWQPEAALSLS